VLQGVSELCEYSWKQDPGKIKEKAGRSEQPFDDTRSKETHRRSTQASTTKQPRSSRTTSLKKNRKSKRQRKMREEEK
jgi:hypothetical protein